MFYYNALYVIYYTKYFIIAILKANILCIDSIVCFVCHSFGNK